MPNLPASFVTSLQCQKIMAQFMNSTLQTYKIIGNKNANIKW